MEATEKEAAKVLARADISLLSLSAGSSRCDAPLGNGLRLGFRNVARHGAPARNTLCLRLWRADRVSFDIFGLYFALSILRLCRFFPVERS